MPVFRAYFKVIRRNIPSLIIYFVVFVAISLIFFKTSGTQSANVFNATEIKVSFFSEEETPLVEGLKTYLSGSTRIISLNDDPETLQDAMFSGKIEYILRVPSGFTESFISGSDSVLLVKTTAPNSTGSVSADMLVNKYLNLVRMYESSLQNLPQEEIVRSVLHDLDQTVPVKITATEEQLDNGGLSDYFRYQAYPILAILLMGVTAVMMAFNDPELRKRNLCAPLKPFKMSLYVFAGNVIFAVAVWALLCAVTLGLYGQIGLTPGVVLLCLNALAFTAVGLSIGFLAGKFIKGEIAQAALTNVVSLGICFLSGVFLDQYLLGDTVLKIASFTPGFWYVKAVETLKDISVFSFENLKPVYACLLIELGFAAVFTVIALIASKQKRQSLSN